jgi:hypothetical protein
MKNTYIILILTVLLRLHAAGQEVITGLYENPVIRAAFEEQKLSGTRDNLDLMTPVSLPFFDDFSQSAVYPDASRWIDQEAFVNSNYGYRSANVGVATLDALDHEGKIHANLNWIPLSIADSLTSRPIRMDSVFSPSPRKITLSDSIYFSFFYQPQGRAAQAPESFDSLILQFGYFTGDSVFANTYDSIWMPLSDYIQPDDTIFPGDTVYSPQDLCGQDIFRIADDYYFYEDMIQLPCDSVFIPEFKWKRIWASEGLSLNEFYEQDSTYSRLVMIPVTDSTKFFRKDFQFRFINLASLANDIEPTWKSNCDQWNVDYIYLDINRSYQDTVFRQVSFVERAPSMLARYEAMPYNQYSNNPGNELKNNLELIITNLDSTIFNSGFEYTVNQVGGSFEHTYLGGNCNLFPFSLNGYQNCISCAAHACPPVNFMFPVSTTTDSAEFVIRHHIIGDITPSDTVSDTISFRQKFFNYYAYDDGTPEAGYGLNLNPSGAMLAYRFTLNVKDTLRAIQMFFNHTQGDANELYFNLMVWQDNNGKPGDVIYSQLNEKVEFSPYLLGFHTYMLDDPLLVNGTFYIGWEQQSPDNLNLGLDRNNSAQQHIFYNTSGEWLQSIQEGALMMRPLLGKPFDLSGISEPDKQPGSITLYPNPTRENRINFRCDGIYKDISSTSDFTISIYNLPGEELYRGAFKQSVETGDIKPGLYIVTVKDEDGQVISVSRLIKN